MKIFIEAVTRLSYDTASKDGQCQIAKVFDISTYRHPGRFLAGVQEHANTWIPAKACPLRLQAGSMPE